MNTSHNQRWSDSEVDELLTNFFRQEIPKEMPPFRGSAESGAIVRASRPSSAATAGRSGVFGVIAAAACLLLVATTFWGNAGSSVPEPSVAKDDHNILKTGTQETGPVELRNDPRWSDVDDETKQSGDELELTIPELQINLNHNESWSPDRVRDSEDRDK